MWCLMCARFETTTGQHFLIVHEEPDDGMDIEHPDGCPRRDVDGMYEQYECGVGQVVDQIGFAHYFRRDPADTWDDTEYVNVGRHPIDYWTETTRNYSGADEFDCGLRLTQAVTR